MAAPIVSGIYAIRNTVNGKLYVGSALNLARRWAKHRLELRHGTNNSRHLQRAWTKHGAKAFVFEVLEYVPDIYSLIAREQHWIDLHQTARGKGYNLCPTAGSALGLRHPKGRKASDETRAKMSASHSTPEARAANSARQLGRKPTQQALANHRAAVNAPGYRANRKALMAGKPFTPGATEKARLATLGKPLSEEHRRKIGAPKIGKPRSPETRAKLRAARLGTTLSAEHKLNIGAGLKRWRESRTALDGLGIKPRAIDCHPPGGGAVDFENPVAGKP